MSAALLSAPQSEALQSGPTNACGSRHTANSADYEKKRDPRSGEITETQTTELDPRPIKEADIKEADIAIEER